MLFGHDPCQLLSSGRVFWQNMHGDFFKHQINFFSFLGNVTHMKNILMIHAHRLIIIVQSYDMPIQFNCWKNKFWRVFGKVARPWHWPPCKLSESPKVTFFQIVLKKWKIIQHGRKNISENRWESHFLKLIESSSYDT